MSRLGFDGAFDLPHGIDQYPTLQEIQRERVYHGRIYVNERLIVSSTLRIIRQ
jgi:hypothetical protein